MKKNTTRVVTRARGSKTRYAPRASSGAPLLGQPCARPPAPGPQVGAERLPGLGSTGGQVRAVGDLPGDLGVAVEEGLLLARVPERRLPRQEDEDVRGDEGERDPGGPTRRVRVTDRDHGRATMLQMPIGKGKQRRARE